MSQRAFAVIIVAGCVMFCATARAQVMRSVSGLSEPWVVEVGPRLAGTWLSQGGEACSVSAPCVFEFSNEEGQQKLKFYSEAEWIGCTLFDVSYAEINGMDYLDLRPTQVCDDGYDHDPDVNGAFALHLLPLHSIWKIELQDQIFVLTALELADSQVVLEDGKWIKNDDDGPAFLGTSEELGTWLQHYGAQATAKEAFLTAARVFEAPRPEATSQPNDTGVAQDCQRDDSHAQKD